MVLFIELPGQSYCLNVGYLADARLDKQNLQRRIIYHFPVELAAKIAVATVARFLSVNEDKFDLVEWVLFDENTEKIYENEVDKIYHDIK